MQKNHEIDCERARIVEREIDCKLHKTNETIQIRLQGAALNRDQGSFLSRIYDPLFADLRRIGGNARASELRVRRSHKDSSFEMST